MRRILTITMAMLGIMAFYPAATQADRVVDEYRSGLQGQKINLEQQKTVLTADIKKMESALSQCKDEQERLASEKILLDLKSKLKQTEDDLAFINREMKDLETFAILKDKTMSVIKEWLEKRDASAFKDVEQECERLNLKSSFETINDKSITIFIDGNTELKLARLFKFVYWSPFAEKGTYEFKNEPLSDVITKLMPDGVDFIIPEQSDLQKKTVTARFKNTFRLRALQQIMDSFLLIYSINHSTLRGNDNYDYNRLLQTLTIPNFADREDKNYSLNVGGVRGLADTMLDENLTAKLINEYQKSLPQKPPGLLEAHDEFLCYTVVYQYLIDNKDRLNEIYANLIINTLRAQFPSNPVFSIQIPVTAKK
ncbi:MAG: hypothetical protein V1701_01735 [Planctomycetota bacterium]